MTDYRRAKVVAAWLLAAVFAVAETAVSAPQQAQGQGGQAPAGAPDKAQAYYHYTLGHLYQERGTMFQRPDLLAKAIDEYRLAQQHDPTSAFLSMELADVYAMTGRFRSAVEEAEAATTRNPNDAEARRLLGRLYVQLLARDRGQQAPPDLEQRAIRQFQEITERYPDDTGSLLILAQLYRVSGDNAKAEATLKRAVAVAPDSADATTQLALLYVDLGQYNTAIELLRKIAGDNADSQVLTALAHAYEQVQDYAAAAETYGRILERNPENHVVRKALGQNLLYGQKYDQALEQFQALVQVTPPQRDPEVYLRLSQVYRFKRDFGQARENLNKAIDLAPDNQELRYNQVLLAEAEGKYPEAASLIQRILDSGAKNDPSAYSPQEKTNRSIFLEKMGTLYSDQNDLAKAEEAYRQMAALGGDGALRGETRLIELYQEKREYDRALRESERAVRDFPESRELKVARASVLAVTGDVREAVNLLTPLLRNTEEDREIWLAVAQVALRGRDFPQAAEALAKAEALSQSDLEKSYVQFLYGSMWERQDRLEPATEAFRKALGFNPNSAGAMNYLGYMFADRGVNLDEAVRLIQQALELEPENGAYLDSLGWAYFKLDNLELAERYLLRAVERVATDPTLREHLGDVYFKTGRIQQAQGEWQAALQEWSRLPQNEREQDEIARIERKLREANARSQ
ncbi:MAG: tetratricopeptide repeat protein [Terriglobia bacterium]